MNDVEIQESFDSGWWKEDENKVMTLETDEMGLTHLMGRMRDDGSWEYAIVYWRYRSPMLHHLFHNGKKLILDIHK